MAKFDFNVSTYKNLWNSSDVRFLMSFINETEALRTNARFAYNHFKKAPTMIITQPNGTAPYEVRSRDKKIAPLMDMRAPLGNPLPMDAEGTEYFRGSIPNLITRGYSETAQERLYKENLYSQFGSDTDIIAQWIDSVQTLKDSADYTLSNMAAQLLSKASIRWDYGQGITNFPVVKYDVPTENKQNAGAKIWTDPDCKILDQMAEKEHEFKIKKGLENVPMKWMIPYDMFHNVIMKNAQVKEFIKSQRHYDYQATTADMVFSTEDVLRYISLYKEISPIEIVSEKQKNSGVNGEFMVQGWEDGVAILKPSGLAGEFQYTEALDRVLYERFGSSSLTKQFSPLEGGLYHLVNTEQNNGAFKEWSTYLIMSAVPSLNGWHQTLYINTKVAD